MFYLATSLPHTLAVWRDVRQTAVSKALTEIQGSQKQPAETSGLSKCYQFVGLEIKMNLSERNDG
jgi:hypothetical protein